MQTYNHYDLSVDGLWHDYNLERTVRAAEGKKGKDPRLPSCCNPSTGIVFGPHAQGSSQNLDLYIPLTSTLE